jgi:RNA polymerase sigma factor FliA
LETPSWLERNMTDQGTVAAPKADLAPVASYLPFVKRIVTRLARRLPSHVQLDDLVSAGVVGLIEAMDRFDPSRVTEFETYAEFRIKGAVLDELRKRDIMARDARLASKQLERTIGTLTSELKREPEETEIAERLEISVEELRQKLERLAPVRVVSLEDIYAIDVGHTDDSLFEQVAREELVTRLKQAMEGLGERHRQVLHLYYREDLTLKEIGVVLGVTESRVCQLVSEATIRLRALLGAEQGERRAHKKVAGGRNV